MTCIIQPKYAFGDFYQKSKKMTGELTEQEINNILSSQAIGRIACCDGKHPYIVPVAYAFDGRFIYGQSTEGRKLEMLRNNPNVCFQVDLSRDLSNWQSALIFGQFEELIGEASNKARDLLEGRVLPLMTGSMIHQHEHWEGEGHELSENYRKKPVMFRIRINEKSGRYEHL
jgi:nitroimidazol reductase NimA-like FMN-containing flavoprotein (pyridoxamine 5'-phosphate oxidase superfamily)